MAAELTVMVPFIPDKEDDEVVVPNWTLKSIPAALTAELTAFERYRQQALNIDRQGSAVVPITCENDKSVCLRE